MIERAPLTSDEEPRGGAGDALIVDDDTEELLGGRFYSESARHDIISTGARLYIYLGASRLYIGAPRDINAIDAKI